MNDPKPTSLALRQRYEREYILPIAKALFEIEPRCQSMLLAVGQYWCDEATDAVHDNLIACEARDPAWPQAAQVYPGAIGDTETLALLLKESAEGHEVCELDLAQGLLFSLARKQAFPDGKAVFTLDNNSDMIVAFASYCHEVSDQEQPSYRSHTPYGIVRRPAPGEDARVEIIGTMHRPEREDRWDVLEHDGIISGFDANDPLPSPHDLHRVASKPRRDPVLLYASIGLLILATVLVLSRC